MLTSLLDKRVTWADGTRTRSGWLRALACPDGMWRALVETTLGFESVVATNLRLAPLEGH